jgi:hypothetical protein
LVDVYEEASATEPADGHRHGWFDSDGELKSTGKHKVDPAKQAASDLKCWYGLWPGIHMDKNSGELPVPPGFADD